MEDEHIQIDDLSSHFGSLLKFPKPSAFYGVMSLRLGCYDLKFDSCVALQLTEDIYVIQVFDGHGGSEAAAYIRKNVIRLLFEDVNFPQASEVTDVFLEEVENSVRKAFHLADQALADDRSVSSSSGTTALTAMIFGR